MFHPNDSLGPYTLIRVLGRGAFGEVWLAERRSSLLTLQAALKLPLDGQTNSDDIRREAQTWLQASGHPNVVPVLDAEEYDGQIVIASEYVSGGSLTGWMAAHEGSAPTPEAALLMAGGILSGLDFLHRHNLIHRDLKPDNVLLQDGLPRLTDFGLTRILMSRGVTASITGTPGYMAPETFQGNYSIASDIWSAGALLYEMLCGMLPYPQTDFYSLMLAKLGDEPPLPLPAVLPEPVRNVVMRALSKKPEDRFASAREMAQSLEKAGRSSPMDSALSAVSVARSLHESGTSFGTYTFLFTDIEGSTRLWEQSPDSMKTSLAQHDALLRRAIAQNAGSVFKTIGDAFCAVFSDPVSALRAAVNAQIQFHEIDLESDSQLPLLVRMALHTGSAERRDNDYFGPALNLVARILAAGHGGQVLLSEAMKTQAVSQLPEGVTLRDLGRHPLRGVSEPEAIWQALHPQVPDSFPPLHTVPLAVHYLPQMLTAVQGRAAETAEAERLLREPGTRLVTITGFGGMGKTRLAMQAAERCLLSFPDGVWWLEMEEITTANGLFARIAERIRLTLHGGASVQDQCLHAIRERRMLLALDNLEQIPDAPEAIRALIAGTREAKCLITSRRAMGLRGERVLEMRPLPDGDAQVLFAARAQEVNPDFVLDDANRADVGLLCQKLEGVPLAIELAAARSRTLSPRQMLERLNERFRLLQSRSPELPPRQRALSAAIEWSYCLLPEEDRAVLAQLSVFAGGFSLEDAEAVCEAFDVLESIDTLRLSSFFFSETQAETQQTRFLMLDSVREYAAERLVETGEEEAVRRRHAEWFLRRAQERMVLLRSAGEVKALDELERSADNLYAAAAWARDSRKVPLGPELALALGQWRQRRGFLRQAATIVQQGMEAALPDRDAHPSLYADLLQERSGLHLDFKEYDAARALAEESLAISDSQGSEDGRSRAENLLGQAAMYEGKFDEARERFSRALEYFVRAGRSVETAIVRNNLGLVERRDTSDEDASARLARSDAHLQEALRLRRALEDHRGLAETLNNLGVTAFARGDLDHASRFYAEALVYEQEVRNTEGVAVALANLGEVAELQQQAARAVRLFTVAERFLEEANSPLLPDVVKMTEHAASSGLTTQELAAARAEAQRLPAERRVEFAMAGGLGAAESAERQNR